MIVFDADSLAHCLWPAANPPRFIVPATLKQLCVQIRQILSARNGYPVISPEVSRFTFNAALLMTFARSAKLCLKFPMRSKCNEPLGFFSAIASQDLFHRASQIVVAQNPEYSRKIGESQLVPLQERLLRRSRIDRKSTRLNY